MVSPASKDTTEDLQEVAGASEVQAPGKQASLPAGQTQVLSEVGHARLALGKGALLAPAPWHRLDRLEVALPRQ